MKIVKKQFHRIYFKYNFLEVKQFDNRIKKKPNIRS